MDFFSGSAEPADEYCELSILAKIFYKEKEK